ncbi:MAG: universal stress protein [bacterium]
MAGKVMVILDSFSMAGEAVQYSIELARRMDYSLLVLILLPLDSEELKSAKDIEKRAQDALRPHISFARDAGVETEAEVRIGDPSSELMKFLAGARSVHTIVWGGKSDISRAGRKKAHWLLKIKHMLECPVVIPSTKT